MSSTPFAIWRFKTLGTLFLDSTETAIHRTRNPPWFRAYQLRKFLAHHLFDEKTFADVYALNSNLVSYVRNHDAPAAWDLFQKMHSNCCCLSHYTFSPVLSACCALPNSNCGLQVHALIIKNGSSSEIVQTALMGLYFKHGFLGYSVRVFEEMDSRDVVTWNTLLLGFLRNGCPLQAIRVWQAMRIEGVAYSEFTICSVLKACTFLKAFHQGKQVHGLVVTMGRDLVILGTALIDFYSNVECVEEAVKVFSSLNCRKDEVMLNCLVSRCLRNRKYETAFSIMRMSPNKIVLTSGLAACAENTDMWVGKQIHGVAMRLALTDDTPLCNALLDMYAKCGEVRIARSVFDGLPRRDVVSWTTMIGAYGTHGYGLEALSLFERMGKGKTSSDLPNAVTLLVVLSACAHSGLVEEGQRCFFKFKDKYGLAPGPEHYGCLIDILGKAGRTEDAWCAFEDMVKNGIKPTVEVWGAVLNACTRNRDFPRGEIAVEHLLKSKPLKAGHFVLLSNFYAANEKWDAVDNLRRMVKSNGVGKRAGSSWVTLAGSTSTHDPQIKQGNVLRN